MTNNLQAVGPRVYIHTLGCAKNTVYSEVLDGMLAARGYAVTEDISQAEVIVINTCGFITAAKEQSIAAILEAAAYKTQGHCKKVITMGCMVQKYADELEEALPEVDLFLGTTRQEDVLQALEDLAPADQGRGRSRVDRNWHLPDQQAYLSRPISTPATYAYLSIAEGCDNRCAYCAIPEMQGPYRSRPMEAIVEEAAALVQRGYKELILIAQDTTYYGKDLYGSFRLADLLRELGQIEDLRWIRILYAYPNNFTDELIEVIASEDKVCHYLDIPFQHADDEILETMNRHISRREMEQLVHRLRSRMPDIVLRSTFITGFPGETEAHFNTLLNFLADMQLDRVGVFPYSQEEGTAAGIRSDQVPEEIRDARAETLMEEQFHIMVGRHEKRLGSEAVVQVEEESPDIDGLLLCRSYGEAPEIDPFILVQSVPGRHTPGDFLKVRIVALDEYDLVGEIIDELA